jgi:hypothetical protein
MSLGLDYAGLNNNLTWPYVGYVNVMGTQTPVDRAVTIGLLAVATVTVIHAVLNERGWRRLAFGATGLFVLLLAPLVLANYQNSLRAAIGLSLIWAIPADPEPDGDRSSRGVRRETRRNQPHPV